MKGKAINLCIHPFSRRRDKIRILDIFSTSITPYSKRRCWVQQNKLVKANGLFLAVKGFQDPSTLFWCCMCTIPFFSPPFSSLCALKFKQYQNVHHIFTSKLLLTSIFACRLKQQFKMVSSKFKIFETRNLDSSCLY